MKSGRRTFNVKQNQGGEMKKNRVTPHRKVECRKGSEKEENGGRKKKRRRSVKPCPTANARRYYT